MTQPTDDPFAPAGAPASPSFATMAASPLWEEEPARRKLPDPETGKPTWTTRASKYAGNLEDPYILRQWEKAMVALGMGRRDDLVALSQSEEVPAHADKEPGWWMPWSNIATQALDAAEYKRGAHLGSAIHRFTERHDGGTLAPSEIPSKWRPHVAKYQELHRALGLEIETIETMILTKDVHNGVNGRLDRRRRCPDGRLIIDDLKTGRNAPLGLDGISIQLSIYAHAGWDFDPVTGIWSPAPEVRQDVALVSWVPVDHPEEGELIPVDIAWGWEAAKVIAWVLDFRLAAKRQVGNRSLRLPIEAVIDGAREVSEQYDESAYLGRIEAAGTLAELSAIYLEAFPAGRWTEDMETAAQRRKLEIKGKVAKLRPVKD